MILDRLMRWLIGPIPLLLIGGLLIFVVQLGLQMRERSLPVSYAGTVVVSAKDTPVVLGYENLGQKPGPKSAAKRHLLVDRKADGWVIANVASDRRVFAQDQDGEGFYLQRWPVQSGDEIVLAGGALKVVEVSERIVLRDVDSGRSVTFAGGEIDPDGETVHEVCHSALSRAARAGRWLLREYAEGEVRLFSVGGGVNCESRWSVENLEPESIHIVWHDGAYHVAPGASRSDVLFLRGSEQPRTFASRSVPVDGIARVILGRTVYLIQSERSSISFEPVANRDLFRGDFPDLELIDVDWAGAGLPPREWMTGQLTWLLPGFVAALVVSFFVRFQMSGRRTPREHRPTATASALAVAAIGGWTTILTQRGEAADVLLRFWLVVASLGFASVVMALRGRLFGIAGMVWVTAISLALLGTGVLLTLGAGADNSQWMRFFDKHALLIAMFGWMIGALGALPSDWLVGGWTGLFNAELLLAGAGALLVVAMGAQLTIGSEAGIAGIQPVELTKSVYVLLIAFAGMHLVELRRRDTREFRRSPLTVLLPFLRTIGGFALVVLSIVVGVRDFSPGIILGLVTLFWLFRIGRNEGGSGLSIWTLTRPTVAVAMAALFAAGAWARANPEALPPGMPQRDRILVWSQPDLHPHSGSQVLSGMDRVAEGGWAGARDWFGPNEEVMKVPAVQDDFITAFLLNRFGGLAGLTLMALQLLYLAVLFSLARRIETATERGDFREQNAGRVAGISLFVLAWMHAIHWSIAWCNTLGLLPVMGQPMTWLSAGNSHLLGFALPTLTIALVTAWVMRDADSPR